MRSRSLTLFALVTLTCGALSSLARAQDFPKASPYAAIRWRQPEVWIDGRWHLLRTIDGIPVEKIIDFAMTKYEDRWQKRFDEDLVQVLTEMGHPPAATVKLVLREVETGKERTIERAAMTEENRRKVMEYKRAPTTRPSAGE